MVRAATKKTAAKKTTASNGNGETVETKPDTVRGIRKMVHDSKGIAKVTLAQVRDELGFARLGKHVLSQMGDHLTENGLGFYPAWVLTEDNTEPRQWQEFWVYERDHTPRSVVLDAMGDPDNHDLAAALDLFNQSAPDYSKMDAEQRLTLVRTILNA